MGSEMCIRDSAVVGADEIVPPCLSDDRSVIRVHSGIDNEQVDRCLLYTSDAADERSSVDLGGRRIIKKKKSRRSDVAWG